MKIKIYFIEKTISFDSSDINSSSIGGSEKTLINIKRQNISLGTYEELQRRFTEDGIPTYSDFILGLPGETYDSFADGVATLIQNGQHNRIQFNNLSVLPNAAEKSLKK